MERIGVQYSRLLEDWKNSPQRDRLDWLLEAKILPCKYLKIQRAVCLDLESFEKGPYQQIVSTACSSYCPSCDNERERSASLATEMPGILNDNRAAQKYWEEDKPVNYALFYFIVFEHIFRGLCQRFSSLKPSDVIFSVHSHTISDKAFLQSKGYQSASVEKDMFGAQDADEAKYDPHSSHVTAYTLLFSPLPHRHGFFETICSKRPGL